MLKYFPFILLLILISCNNKPSNKENINPLAKIKLKMGKEEVVKLAGEPTSKEDLGSFVNRDTLRSGGLNYTVNIDSTHMERWSFGNNMEILFSNDSVSGIDTNIVLTQQHLRHVMDSARQTQGQNSQGMIQSQ